MSDLTEGVIGGVLGFIVVIAFIALSVAVSKTGIANSCELSGSFVVSGKAYKCELMK
jgi:hypothetical protein